MLVSVSSKTKNLLVPSIVEGHYGLVEFDARMTLKVGEIRPRAVSQKPEDGKR